MKLRYILWSVLFIFQVKNVYAQQAVTHLNLLEAERLFLSNNFELLASKYDIEKSKAEIITAKLFDNPELSYENLLYNRETKKFFETSMATGQYSFQITQLIKLAGKRNKGILLAQTGAKVSEQEYFDLLRTLKFQLRTNFYKAYYDSQSLGIYEQQIESSTKLVNVYEEQYRLGNIALKDLLRIKALLIKLKADLAALQNSLEDNYRDLKIICGLPANTLLALELPKSSGAELDIEKITYTTLLDSAQSNRTDLKLAKLNLQYNETNLRLQKAMAVPDVEIALSYDLKGNYPEKYTGLGVKIPIPLFNRNQGEIKKAKIAIDMANMYIQKQENLLENELFNCYKTALRNEKLFQAFDPKFDADFQKLIAGLIKNLSDRSISLIEFLDLYDAYKESIVQLNSLKFERIKAREEINYVTGSTIFK